MEDRLSDERQPLLDSVIESTEEQGRNERHGEYRDYKRRWYILATLAVLNVSNGLVWKIVPYSLFICFSCT